MKSPQCTIDTRLLVMFVASHLTSFLITNSVMLSCKSLYCLLQATVRICFFQKFGHFIADIRVSVMIGVVIVNCDGCMVI